MPKTFIKRSDTTNGVTQYSWDQYYIQSLIMDDLLVYFNMGSDGIDETPGAPNWSSADIVGSTAPIRVYNSNGSRVVAFSHTFVDDYTGVDLMEVRDALACMEYPIYNNGIVIPHLVRMRLGKILIRGTLSNLQYNWAGPIRSGYHTQLKVSLSVEELRNETFDANSIRNGFWSTEG